MVGEFDTSPIVTRLEFIADFTPLDEMMNRLGNIDSTLPHGGIDKWVNDSSQALNKYVTDSSQALDTLSVKFDESVQRWRNSLGQFTTAPIIIDTSALGPLKDMENQLDGLSGSFRSSSEALVSTNEDFYNLGLASGKTAGDLLNADEAGRKITTTMQRLGKETYSTTTIENQFGDVIDTNIKKMTTNQQRFQFWTLGLMFFGMQLQRTFGKAWQTMSNAYTKITGNTTALGQANLRLSASMTFLQVSIMTALEPALLPLIEAIIDLVNWFSDLPEPIKEVAGLLIVGGAFTGGILYAAGAILSFTKNTIPQLITALTGAGGVTTAIDEFTGKVTTSTATLNNLTFLPYATAALTALLIIINGWEHFSKAIELEDIKTQAARINNWTLFKDATLAQEGELEQGIIQGFENMGLKIIQLGDAINNFVIRIAYAGRILFLQILGNIPGMAEWANEQINKVTTQETETFKQRYYEQFQFAKNFYEGMVQINIDYLSSLRESGVSWKDLIAMYGQDEEGKLKLIDVADKLGQIQEYNNAVMSKLNETTTALNTSTQQTTINVQSVTDSYDSNVKAIELQIEKNNELTTSFSNVTKQVNGLANAWKIAGTAGVWTFKAGTSEADIQKSIGQIQTSKKATYGDFIWRAGEGVTQISPNDTVIGTQGTIGGGVSVGDINVNVTTGPISNDIDVKDLANKVSDEIMRDIRNYTKYVPTW